MLFLNSFDGFSMVGGLKWTQPGINNDGGESLNVKAVHHLGGLEDGWMRLLTESRKSQATS